MIFLTFIFSWRNVLKEVVGWQLNIFFGMIFAGFYGA